MTDRTFTIWRTIFIIGTVMGLGGVIAEMVWSADKEKLNGMHVVAMAASAKVTVDGAVETTLGNMAGQVIGAKLEKRWIRLCGMSTS